MEYCESTYASGEQFSFNVTCRITVRGCPVHDLLVFHKFKKGLCLKIIGILH